MIYKRVKEAFIGAGALIRIITGFFLSLFFFISVYNAVQFYIRTALQF